MNKYIYLIRDLDVISTSEAKGVFCQATTLSGLMIIPK
jgi:hypothetical protein